MKKYILGLKIFSLITLFCTVTLLLLLFASSLMPSSVSQKFTDKVTDDVNSSLNIQDKIDQNKEIQEIKIVVNHTGVIFSDDSIELRAVDKNNPSNDITDKVQFSLEEIPGASNVEDATITDGKLKLPTYGQVKVVATMKSDPTITASTNFTCNGEDPILAYSQNGNDVIGVETNFNVGDRVGISLNGDKTLMGLLKVTSGDEKVVTYYMGSLYAVGVGTTTLKFDISDYGTNGESVVIEKEVEVSPCETEIPQIKCADDMEIALGERFDLNYLLDDSLDDSSYTHCYIQVVDGSQDVLHVYSGTNMYTKGYGTVTVRLTSIFDSTNFDEIVITVPRVLPQSIRIIGDEKIMPHSGTAYSVSEEDLPVTWSVVKGQNKAAITEGGTLTTTFYGKIVIRCTSVEDPTLFAEKTVQSTLYTSAYMFVRKLMGHAGLSALLGFGMVFTALLLFRKKYLSVVIVPAAFAYACISELLQKITPGRYCLMSDVVVDFVGALFGMAVGIVLLAVILIVWRLVSKNSFQKLLAANSAVSFKTVFRKVDNLCTTTVADDCCDQ